MKHNLLFALLFAANLLSAQALTLPANGGNIPCGISQRVGITDINIQWNAPGVKGREGKIWGTQIVHYGFQNLGFGTAKTSPWRAGANENTTITFGTEVMVEGKVLPAGKYGFHIAVFPDSCTLIFSKNSSAWGSYFYDPAEDALRVSVRQEKNLPLSRERLAYEFSNSQENSVQIALLWEYWRIPFTVSIDLNKVIVASMRKELQSDKGFIFENWRDAANYCLQNNYNLEEALVWADNAINPPFGVENFGTISLKANILGKMDKAKEMEDAMKLALEKASVLDIHLYGRQLLAEKKPEKAMEIFQLNYKRNGDAWPVHVGLARGYSAMGDLKKALEQAQIALKQAPDDSEKLNLEAMVKTLREGKPLK